jgi:hypothetical protein
MPWALSTRNPLARFSKRRRIYRRWNFVRPLTDYQRQTVPGKYSSLKHLPGDSSMPISAYLAKGCPAYSAVLALWLNDDFYTKVEQSFLPFCVILGLLKVLILFPIFSLSFCVIRYPFHLHQQISS